ncbi:hypothetical protein L227DRAFT_204851 [Lentinus tigrinus ALCF2SS1-6]|uniref:Uncharacterized protein n=1 Tax=Lentinus tigrinus ALCF2SS1-6 TaxID=1328759 RepID=A0A5C2SVB6_9APHY|nr:hypothetical protein L227DRAFT_204851 [Lentinus tigrinus ALCF2SS1-6]
MATTKASITLRAATPFNVECASIHPQRLTHWMSRDLSRQTWCQYEPFVRYLLSLCRSGPSSVNTLDDETYMVCLEGAVQVANDPDMREKLNNYCATTTNETDRYAAFVDAFNHALQLLRVLPLKNEQHRGVLRNPSDDVVLMRNDPKRLKGEYRDGTSERSPHNHGIASRIRRAQRFHGTP